MAQTTVKVNSVNEFFKAIAPNTTIELAEGIYHLDEIDSTLLNQHCNWAMVLFDEIIFDETDYDNKTLLVLGVENLIIKSSKKARGKVRIVTKRRAASVMAFKQCEGLRLEGIVFGHDIDKFKMAEWHSFCSGEVLEFFDCKKIVLKYDTLFGCGTRGFLAHRCAELLIYKSVIKECNYGAFGLFDSENIRMESCTILNNTYTKLIEMVGSKNFTSKKSVVEKNHGGPFAEIVMYIPDGENIYLQGFKLVGNDFPDKEFYLIMEDF